MISGAATVKRKKDVSTRRYTYCIFIVIIENYYR